MRSPSPAVLRPYASVFLLLVTFLAGADHRPLEARPAVDTPRRAELLAPLDNAVVVESALKIAITQPQGSDNTLYISESPFDPAAPATGVRSLSVDGPVLDAARLDLRVQRRTTFHWSVTSVDRETGRTAHTALRSFTLLPNFQVAAPSSPLVRRETRGKMSGAAVAESRRLRLAAGYDFDTQLGEPVMVEAAKPGAATGGRAAFLVQFDHAPTEDDRAGLAARGLIPVAYVPDNALLVRGESSDRPAIEALPGVAWTGDYHPAYKVSPAAAPEGTAGDETLMVLLFPDAEFEPALNRLRGLGSVILESSDNGINKIARIRQGAGRALEVARLSEVVWVEPYIRPVMNNDNAQWVVQTNINGNRRLWTMGITGAGQVVHTSDSGIRADHNQFRDNAVALPAFGDYPTHRKIIAYKRGSNSSSIAFGDHAGASYHGTHTGGTICGNDDPVSTSLRDGMAKGAKIYFHDCGGAALGNGIDHFPDLNDLFLEAYNGNAGGAARVSSNSWGASNGGAYDISSMQCDQFMWSHKDFLIFFSNGNSGAVNTVGSPATAKNVVSAGGTQNGVSAGSIYASTSRGPTDDGRRKPTVCSPGQSVFSANGSGTTGYQSLSGTSMASPSQAGAATLIRAYLVDGWYPTGTAVPANGFEPSAALLKAMVINSADNGVSGFTAPDNNIGYGRVMADNVCYFAGDTRKLLAIDNNPGLGQDDFIEYEIQVTSSAIPLEVSLCWTDYPASPASGTQLVNNLNLTVSMGATVYRGNVYSGGFSTTGGSYDNLNVEEAVLVNNPPVGTWLVRIEAPAVPFGPQPFGLAVTGAIDDGSGTLYLDRAEYGSTDAVQIKVIDTNAGPTVSVHLDSPTEPTGETVVIPGANGVYEGTLRLSPYAPLGDVADDTLRVTHGDLLTATYNDASPAATLTAKASVAIETPVITNVTGSSRGSTAARITWTTNLNATSKVYYGLTPALELGSVSDATAALSHDMLVPGLTTGSTYYYDVESVGLNGNLVRDDNGGAHYRVTLDPPADILLVIGDTTFDRTEAYEEALTDAGWSYDLWEGSLAENPALGDTLSGLRSYKAVLWQVGFEQYPPFSDTQRTTIGNYMNGGGRLAVSSHDVAWAFGDATSPFYSVDRSNWMRDYLHATWQADPATWSSNTGIAADPISGAYTGGVTYTPIRSGAAGDEVDGFAGTGTFNYTWRSTDGTPDDIGLRWANLVNNGSPDSALWGGLPSRVVPMFFEWSAINPPFSTPNAARTDILHKTIVWLIGRALPQVAVTFPAGGETVTSDTIMVAWTESTFGGTNVATRIIEYSSDGGSSWTQVVSGAGASPYAWDVTGLPNSTMMRVRVRVRDDGDPSLAGSDLSDTNFTLARPSSDTQGPLVTTGSIAATPNPFVQAAAASLTANISDATRGGSTVTAAEWSRGASAAAPGSGTPMTGPFNAVTVAVSASVVTKPIPAGLHTFWIRGRDAAGNWGPAAALDVVVNPGAFPVAVSDCPPDTNVAAPSSTMLSFTVRNTGTAADTIHWALDDLGPGPNVTLDGGNQSGSVFLAPSGSHVIPGVSVTATGSAAVSEFAEIRLVTRPASDLAAADTCSARVTVSSTSGVALLDGENRFGVGPNRPNPFRGSTSILFRLARAEEAWVRIYSLDGRLVRTLAEAPMDGGVHEMEWDGMDARGVELPSGVYFYSVGTASGDRATGRMLRLR